MPKLASIRFQVAILIQEKNGVYYARCPFLNVTTHADSPDKAFRNARQEIDFLFKTALQEGSLVDLLDYRTSLNPELASPDDFVQLEIRHADLDLPRDIPEYLLKRFADAPEIPA